MDLLVVGLLFFTGVLSALGLGFSMTSRRGKH
jgi:hypothetical protein